MHDLAPQRPRAVDVDPFGRGSWLVDDVAARAHLPGVPRHPLRAAARRRTALPGLEIIFINIRVHWDDSR